MCNFQTIPGEIFQVFVKFRQTFGPFQKAQLFGVSYTQIPSPSCITTFMMTMTPKYTRKTFLHLIVPNVCTLSLAAAVRKWAEASNCNWWDKLPKCGEFSRAAAATQPLVWCQWSHRATTRSYSEEGLGTRHSTMQHSTVQHDLCSESKCCKYLKHPLAPLHTFCT